MSVNKSAIYFEKSPVLPIKSPIINSIIENFKDFFFQNNQKSFQKFDLAKNWNDENEFLIEFGINPNANIDESKLIENVGENMFEHSFDQVFR